MLYASQPAPRLAAERLQFVSLKVGRQFHRIAATTVDKEGLSRRLKTQDKRKGWTVDFVPSQHAAS